MSQIAKVGVAVAATTAAAVGYYFYQKSSGGCCSAQSADSCSTGACTDSKGATKGCCGNPNSLFTAHDGLCKGTVAIGEEKDFASKLAAFSKEVAQMNGELYVLVTAQRNADGRPWCPDCAKGEPLISARLQSLKTNGRKIFLVEAPCERMQYKGFEVDCNGKECIKKTGEKHPYRTEATLFGGVTAIPTLYKWDVTANKATARLIEEDCTKVDVLHNFLA